MPVNSYSAAAFREWNNGNFTFPDVQSKALYYLLSFVSGGVLMAMEVSSAKLMAPFFGNALYVWSAMIGTTLAGLAAGYFYAGVLSEKQQAQKTLFKSSVVTTLYLVALPFYSELVLQMLLPLGIRGGVFFSTLLFNFPLFFLFGLFSPLVIQHLSRGTRQGGVYTGRIYGVSTFSGVLFLAITSLHLMPHYGVDVVIFGSAALFALMTTLQFFSLKSSGSLSHPSTANP